MRCLKGSKAKRVEGEEAEARMLYIMKVLVIDDDVLLLKAFKRWLEAKGRQVITASSGTEGLVKAKSSKPDVILLDIIMPDMDGKAVLRWLKDDPATAAIPVIMLTVKNRAGDVIDTVENAGAADYVVKTPAFEAIIARAQGAIEKIDIEGLSSLMNEIDARIQKYAGKNLRKGGLK